MAPRGTAGLGRIDLVNAELRGNLLVHPTAQHLPEHLTLALECGKTLLELRAPGARGTRVRAASRSM